MNYGKRGHHGEGKHPTSSGRHDDIYAVLALEIKENFI